MHAQSGRRRIPNSARITGIATAGLWAAAFLLFTGEASHNVPIGDGTVQLIVYWLLALGCAGFWSTFLRTSEQLVREDWHIAYELDAYAILSPTRDRGVDRVLAGGLAQEQRPGFWSAGIWRTLMRVGLAFWVASAAVTAALAAGWLVMPSPQRGILLTMLLVPAVHGTAAGIIGPGLTRMLELREAAREARRRLCEHGSHPASWPFPDGDGPSARSADGDAPVADLLTWHRPARPYVLGRDAARNDRRYG